eukprot:scaffold429491_cov41-Prasinocladus_malaysianus.AAC.1
MDSAAAAFSVDLSASAAATQPSSTRPVRGNAPATDERWFGYPAGGGLPALGTDATAVRAVDGCAIFPFQNARMQLARVPDVYGVTAQQGNVVPAGSRIQNFRSSATANGYRQSVTGSAHGQAINNGMPRITSGVELQRAPSLLFAMEVQPIIR